MNPRRTALLLVRAATGGLIAGALVAGAWIAALGILVAVFLGYMAGQLVEGDDDEWTWR